MKAASIITFLMLLALAGPVQAAMRQDDGQYVVHVVTMGPGPELFARFGHIGLVVEDRQAQTMQVYNFGTFDFLDPDLRMKYALGDLRYWLSIEPYTPMVRYYREVDRDVVLRTLNLPSDKAAWLAKRLDLLALPQNREYLYRHYTDNCCTRIRDLVDQVTDGAISKARRGELTGRTFRDWTRRALEGQLVTGPVIDFCLGSAVDSPLDRWQEEFLPELFSEDLDTAVLASGEPVVARRRIVTERQGPSPSEFGESFDAPVLFTLGALLFIGVILPILLGQRRPGLTHRAAGLGLCTFGLVAGLGGLILLLFWTITTHYDTHGNENLLPFLPTHLWLLLPGAMLLRRGALSPRFAAAVRRYLLASLVVIGVALLLKLRPTSQDNYGVIAVAAGFEVLLLLSLRRTGIFKRWTW